MARTVGDFFWDRLYQWGVRRVFGYPGDEQAQAFTSTLIKGDPEQGSTIIDTAWEQRCPPGRRN